MPMGNPLQRYDEGVFKTLTDKWLQGLDPQKDLTPAQTAKMLMGGLVRDIKPDALDKAAAMARLPVASAVARSPGPSRKRSRRPGAA